MKRKSLHVLRLIFAFSLIIVSIIVLAVFWPMPDIPTPEKHGLILIKSINVIDVAAGEIIPNQDILIENDRIRSISNTGTQNSYSNVLSIDGFGKYLLPGLWDMHTHSSPYSPWLHHPLYIANGVTGIRDMSGQLSEKDSYWVGSEERLEWNLQLKAKIRTSPRYVLQSSFQINGSNSVPDNFPDFFKVSTDEDVLKLLEYYQKEGADFIKVYSEIAANSYRTLVRESSNYGLHVAGHKPLGISLEEAILLGQRSFEHGRIFMFDCFTESDQLLLAKDKIAAYIKLKPNMVESFDQKKAHRLMDLMYENNSYWTPTLQTLKVDTYSNVQQLKSNPHLKYIPKMREALWWNPFLGRDGKEKDAAQHRLNVDFYEAVKSQVQMAAKHQVPIMAGTDVTDTNVIPGFSLHAELADLVEAGLTNQEALMSATITPAKYCNLENDFGSIDKGKIADLLILARNPLEDIGNTRSIEGVFLGGSYYDIDQLDELKSITESVASTLHMNVKFVYSLLGSPLMRIQLAD